MSNLFGWRNPANDVFGDIFYPARRRAESESLWGWNPAVDVFDNDANIVIKAELPGVDKKDIVVDVKDRVLTLKGERSTDSEVKEDKYYHRERTFGKFERSFTLPANAKVEDIKADYKDGVLSIDIPKSEAAQPKKITVH
jgi:HSP20 family protein